MEEKTKTVLDRFLERADLAEMEVSVAARIANGRQQLEETTAALQKLRDEQIKLEQRYVGISHQLKAMADLASELQSRHETDTAQATVTNQEAVTGTSAG